MNKYKAFEEKVFEWLMRKHESDPAFTFSLRQKANKGAELDYFIGTENSNYFGTTLWYVPVYFPGSSTDLINLMFRLTDKGYNYYIQFNQTNTPPDAQNETALLMIKTMAAEAKAIFNSTYENGTEKKMFFFQINSPEKEYRDIDVMLQDTDKDLQKLMPLVDSNIASFKVVDPNFRAGRFTAAEFDKMMLKLKRRRTIYSEERAVVPEKKDLIVDGPEPLEDEMEFPLNQILFGPPGTGKTFNTINKAVAIANPGFKTEAASREAIHAEYERLTEQGNIQFTTFHQSMSYEDFIEGIKPRSGSGGKELKYPIVPGIFKRMCFAALKSSCEVNMETDEEPGFDNLWKLFIEHLKKTYKADSYPFITKENSEMYPDKSELDKGRIVAYYRYNNSSVKKGAGTTPFLIPPDRIQKMRDEGITDNETNLTQRLKPIMSYHLSASYAVYKTFLTFLKSSTGKELSEVPDLGAYEEEDGRYEEYLNRYRLLQKKDRPIMKGARFVLIIDEINRANVSQVFGELITLLEDDKRFGKTESLAVKLPYSQQEFAVPDNLYIIGTMNTADRSVEALDTALRRRFVFDEMIPDASLLKPQSMLEHFNSRFTSNYFGLHEEEFYKNVVTSFDAMIGYDRTTQSFSDVISDDEDPGMPDISGNADIAKIVFNSSIRFDILLQTINNRIAKLLTKDQQIGHAFFINVTSVSELYEVFYQKLIPQLQEYFYGDFGKVGLILGNSFIASNNATVPFADFEYEDKNLLQQKKLYEIIVFEKNGDIDEQAFVSAVRRIYQPLKSGK